MIKVRVGGVPEHFNLALHLAIEDNAFKKEGIDIEWNDMPGGTGAMCRALHDDELDIAIALTEGVVSDFMCGNPSKIVQFYVNSPLCWGIYVAGNSPINSISEIEKKKYAISRYNSGSHLMAFVNANNHQLKIFNNDFVLVGNLSGAREALKMNTAQIFMWEKFTTKPLVDSGEFKIIGECRTPWPCFVIAVRNQFIDAHEEVLTRILNIINLYCLLLKNNSAAPILIANRYGIKLEDAKLWFQELEYAYEPQIDEYVMLQACAEMKKYGIINHIPQMEEICYGKNIMLME